MLDKGRAIGSTFELPPGAADFNLRDFGGYRTVSGGRLRTGRLFRSGQLETAGGALAGVLAALDVRAIIDLRAESERKAVPGTAFDGFAGTIHSASAPDETIPHAVGAFMTMTSVDEVIAHMSAIYRDLPSNPRFRQSMGHLVHALAGDAGAMLVHCFAGKDRTGLAVALVQLALGVHRDDVFHDYMQTNAMGPGRIAMGLESLLQRHKLAAPEWIRYEVMSVRPEYLEAGLARIRQEYESPATYFAQVAGLDAVALSRIGEGLLG